jgi:hypothetical protein
MLQINVCYIPSEKYYIQNYFLPLTDFIAPKFRDLTGKNVGDKLIRMNRFCIIIECVVITHLGA